MPETIITHPDNRSRRYSPSRCSIGCPGWNRPAEAALTERQRSQLVDPARSKSAYFRLLARDPDILEGADATDKDIFYNPVRPAARRARTGRSRDLAAQRLHLLRLGACPPRRDLFEAGRGRAAFAGRWGRRPISASAGMPSSPPRWRSRATPIAFGHVACRRGCARRAWTIARNRRRDQRRGFLQLGQQADAVAWVSPASPAIIDAIRPTLRAAIQRYPTSR